MPDSYENPKHSSIGLQWRVLKHQQRLHDNWIWLMAYGLYLCKSMHFRAVITPLNQSNWLIPFHMSLYQRHSRVPPTLTCQGCCGPHSPDLRARLLQIRLIEGRQVTRVLVIHWRGFLLHSQNLRKKKNKKKISEICRKKKLLYQFRVPKLSP